MHRTRLPIAAPCDADWNAMPGTETRRFCTHCRKHVHDLSALSEHEAHALLRTQGRLCVQYRTDAAGYILFQPEGGEVRPARPRAGHASAVSVAAAAAVLAACEPAQPVDGYDEGAAGYALQASDGGDAWDEDAGVGLDPVVGDWLDGDPLGGGPVLVGHGVGGAVISPHGDGTGASDTPDAPAGDSPPDASEGSDGSPTAAEVTQPPRLRVIGEAPVEGRIFRGKPASATMALMGDVAFGR